MQLALLVKYAVEETT